MSIFKRLKTEKVTLRATLAALGAPWGSPALLLLCGLLITPVLPQRTSAAPVYTVLASREAAGSVEFLRDLGEMWRRLTQPLPGRLAAAYAEDGEARLRLLARGRGHFAIVDTPTAVRRLPEYPRLAAIGLLWPEYLHVLATDTRATALGLPISRTLRIGSSARYLYDGLLEWSQDKPEQGDLLEFAGAADLFFEPLHQELLIFSAPAPTEKVAVALMENPGLKLLPVSPKLVEELRLLFPWLQTGRLPKEVYPGVRGRLELPVRHLLMVGRRDLTDPVVAKMLRTLYRRKAAVAPFNPLFGTLDEKQNLLFAKLIPFHPVAAKTFKFPGAKR